MPGETAAIEQTFAVKSTILLTATLTVMASAIVSPSLPALEQHFAGFPRIDYLTKFVVTLPALFMAVSAPMAGYFIDHFGRRTLLAGAVVLYAIAGSSGAIFDSITAILVSRALLGIANAAIMTSVGTLVGDYYSGAARNQMAGFRGAFNNFGGVIYLLLGGVLASLDWRAPFLVYLIAFAVLPLILRNIYEPTRVPAQADWTNGGAGTEPVPWARIVGTYASAFIFGATFYMIPTQIPFHLLQMGFPESSLAGAAVAASTFVTAVTSLFYGRIRGFLSPGTMFVCGFALMAGGFAIVASGSSLVQVFAGLMVFGTGMGLTMPNFSIRLLELAPRRIRGRILGGQATSIMVGFFVSPLLSQPIAKTWGISTAFGAGSSLLTLLAFAFVIVLVRARSDRSREA